MILLIALACSNDPSVPLEPWSEDPNQLTQRCEEEELIEFKITCYVQAASLFGIANQEAKGAALCQQIEDQIWKEECHFRLGEELAVAGNLPAGLRHCSLSGRFTHNCLTHAIWRAPDSTRFPSQLGAKKIFQEWQGWSSEAQSALGDLPSKQKQEALEDLNARFGYSVYFGTGNLFPEAAHLSPPIGPGLRTAFAMEAARLLHSRGEASVENIVDHWKKGTKLQGASQEKAYQQGRYYPAILSPFEKDIEKINLYGGGKRLVSSDHSEDIIIAALEAMFWLEETTPDTFLAWATHPSGPIRWTAIKLMRLCEDDGFAWQDTFDTLLQKADPATRWHIEDALQKGTHLGKQR